MIKFANPPHGKKGTSRKYKAAILKNKELFFEYYFVFVMGQPL